MDRRTEWEPSDLPQAVNCPQSLSPENRLPESTPQQNLERVLQHLRLYEHPLLTFDARQKNDAVEVVIAFKDPDVPVHTYYFEIHPRDLADPQFEWTFQRQLYDCLHDYFIEMFTRTPQMKKERA